MVLSRYVNVLRNTGKILRLRFEVNHEKSLSRRVENVRFHSTQNNEKVENLSITTKLSADPKILQENSTNISQHESVPSVEDKMNESDSFGSEHFTSDDLSVENYLNEDVKLPGALDTCDEDLSYILPDQKPTFNLAAYANSSPVIQELAKLGVKLYLIEKNPKATTLLLRRTFDDLKPHLQFLHDSGVSAKDMGHFLTKNPLIFSQDIDDLHTRIRYLRAHEFDRDMIARIVTKNPRWLMFNTQKIDERLGYFQREYDLNGHDVRYLTTKQPRLITYSFKHLQESNFAIREEMGFNKKEVKIILLDQPRLFMNRREKVVEVFDFAHNTMKLSHEMICQQPKILTCRLEKLRHRHEFLKLVGRAQYDPTKPLYVSVDALVSGTDLDFCQNVTKTTIETYNIYLKTL